MSRIITITLSKEDNPNISYQLNDLFIRLINDKFDLESFAQNKNLQASDFQTILENLLAINADSATALHAMIEVAQLLVAIIIYLKNGYSAAVAVAYKEEQ
ncbi:hypothetical protein [Ignatzschineria sp. LJL83]